MLDALAAPAHLDERSAAVWNQLAPMMRKALMLTEADVVAFEMLCNAVADARLARERRGEKFTSMSSKGVQMLDQLLVAEQMLVKRVESLGARFGMDPASRSRLIVDPQLGLFGNDAPPPAPKSTARFFK